MPSATVVSLGCATRSTRPAVGARSANAARAGRCRSRAPPSSAARACSTSWPATWRSSSAASSSFCAASAASRSVSSLVAETKPSRGELLAALQLRCAACCSDTFAPAMRALTRCTCASAISTRSCCSRSVRSSSIGDSTGVSVGDHGVGRRPRRPRAGDAREQRRRAAPRRRSGRAGASCRPRRSSSRSGPASPPPPRLPPAAARRPRPGSAAAAAAPQAA